MKKWRTSELALLITGLIMFIWSWVSEIYFHYVADFHPDEVGEELFWRAEYSELVNSLFLFIGGIVLIILAFYFRKKRMACQESNFETESCKSFE